MTEMTLSTGPFYYIQLSIDIREGADVTPFCETFRNLCKLVLLQWRTENKLEPYSATFPSYPTLELSNTSHLILNLDCDSNLLSRPQELTGKKMDAFAQLLLAQLKPVIEAYTPTLGFEKWDFSIGKIYMSAY